MRAVSLTRLVLAAAACSTLALPAAAAAQSSRDRDGGWQNNRSWENRVGGEGYQRGYRDGERLGDEDQRRNRAFNVQSHREYREADEGYDRNDGSRDRYRDDYRRGFTEGYRIGYRDDRWARNDRNDRWNNGAWNRGYRDPGQARGFSDGYRKGAEDRNDNHRFEPERFKEVRQGTAPGYDDDFGSRDRYTASYRNGFRLGYEDGFRLTYARR
jgi:flagellar biosynthesis/type III secretory pathway protein FliH